MACHSCPQPEFYPCAKCGHSYCMAHRYRHGCPCDVPGCGKPSEGLCQGVPSCNKVLCRTHQNPKVHTCVLCSHSTAPGGGCAERAQAECPTCHRHYCETHLGRHSHQTLVPRGNVSCNTGSALRRLGRGGFKDNASAGNCAICGQAAQVVVCPDCGKPVCAKDNAHTAPSTEMDIVISGCIGVASPARRAILLGRVPDGATATAPTQLVLRCNRVLTPLIADRRVAVDGFDALGGCANLGQLYRLLLGSRALRMACAEGALQWVAKGRRLPASDRLGDLALDQLSRTLVTVDMTRSGWLDTMLLLCELRAKVNQRHAQTQAAVRSLACLSFEGCSVWVFNHKTAEGDGTTRMIWPLRLADDPHELRDHQVRVADLTYGELSQLVLNVLLPAFKNDHAQLAELLLQVLDGVGSAVGRLRAVTCRITRLRCSFLRGGVLTDGGLQLCPQWWLTRKSQSAVECDLRPTAYELAVNLLAILFLAEPRHARTMFPSTRVLLEMVSDGYITFADVFSTLGGIIAHGRLLPGANVLGPPLRLAPDRKRQAMPMAELPESARAVLDSDERSALPEAQPLMKVLFMALLLPVFLAGWRRTEPEREEGNLDRLDADESNDHEDGLEGDRV